MAKSNGTGKGGKSFQDRELAAKVRTLGLQQLHDVLDCTHVLYDIELHKAVLLKLSSSILPRLNEHTGAEGGAIEIAGVTINVRK